MDSKNKTNFIESFDNFTFRCHYLGELMTKPKGLSYREQYNEAKAIYDKALNDYQNIVNKSTKTAENTLLRIEKYEERVCMLENFVDIPNISGTAKSRLVQIYTEATTGRKKEIKSKFLEKGTLLEEDAITDYSLFSGKMYRKNKVRFDNLFINGEVDFEDDIEDMVVDTKVSWDIFTFDSVMSKVINPIYHWQLEGYMWGRNKKKGRLVYSLQNTPEKLILLEEKKLLYNWLGSEEEYKEACEQLRFNHTYDDLSLERKLRIFDVERNDDRIDMIKEKVKDCRKYLNRILKKEQDETED